jgi:hypothetical protein
MEFNKVVEITESLILEKRSYKHRQGYKGNEKGSYIDKGKTYWDYSNGATPGNERLVSQIQNKCVTKFDTHVSREKIKDYLKSDKSQKSFDRLSKIANSKFGDDENNPKWRAYVYGGLSTIVAKTLTKEKGNARAISNVL